MDPSCYMDDCNFFSHQPEGVGTLSGRFMGMVEVIDILDMDPRQRSASYDQKGTFRRICHTGFLLFPAVLSVINKRISSFVTTQQVPSTGLTAAPAFSFPAAAVR